MNLMIMIHNSYDYPDWSDQSLLLGMKVMAQLGMNPTLTHSSSDLRSLSVKERGCYYKDEFPLQNFGYYTYQNCLTECRMNLSRYYCGCIPVIYLNEQGNAGDYTICSLRDIECLSKFRPSIRSSVPGVEIEADNSTDFVIDISKRPCDCLPECASPIYHFQVSSSLIETRYSPSIEHYGLYHGIDLDNHSVVRVFFNDLVGTRYRRIVLGNWQTFLAFYGGILGLCLGFSFIAGIEFIYFFTVKLFIEFGSEKNMEKRKQKMKKRFSHDNDKVRKIHVLNRKSLGFNGETKDNSYLDIYLE